MVGFYLNDMFEIDEVFMYLLSIYCYFVNRNRDLNKVLMDFVKLSMYGFYYKIWKIIVFLECLYIIVFFL